MDEKKLDSMFDWIEDKLPIDVWYPSGEKKLSQEQVTYIKELMNHELPALNGLEFNSDFSKIRKVDLIGYKRIN